MAEVITKTIDLLNIKSYVDRIPGKHNCLVDGMSNETISRVIWELVAQMPMMKMDCMLSSVEHLIPSTGFIMQDTHREKLKDGKQKLILCPLQIYSERKLPKCYSRFNIDEDREMSACAYSTGHAGELGESFLFIDRDGLLHFIQVAWKTDQERLYPMMPRLVSSSFVLQRTLRSPAELESCVDGMSMKVVLYQALNYLMLSLEKTEYRARKKFELFLDTIKEDMALEKYKMILRAADLRKQVQIQVHERYEQYP